MKTLRTLLFWLTTSRRCAWHPSDKGRILRRAWFHRQFTDGLCPDCARKMMLATVKPMPCVLDEPNVRFQLSTGVTK